MSALSRPLQKYEVGKHQCLMSHQLTNRKTEVILIHSLSPLPDKKTVNKDQVTNKTHFFPEKLIVTYLVKKIPAFMEPCINYCVHKIPPL